MFQSVIKVNKENAFEYFWDLYQHSKIPDEKIMALVSLGSSLDEKRKQFLLKNILGNTIKLQDKIYIFASLSLNFKYRNEIMKFTINNFKEMFTGNSTFLSYVVESVFSYAVYEPSSSEVLIF